jgi:hypothetical protein
MLLNFCSSALVEIESEVQEYIRTINGFGVLRLLSAAAKTGRRISC